MYYQYTGEQLRSQLRFWETEQARYSALAENHTGAGLLELANRMKWEANIAAASALRVRKELVEANT
ncbi:MAG: hypothetical protein RLZZ283_632 [Candidatus Parcubacteria bacterium]|jgi:hypothetical protein